MPDHQEVEWQFEAPDLDLVQSWLGEHPTASGLAAVPGATKELLDTYYDTRDWRLYRAGYALRVRREGERLEATMKALTPAEGAMRRRREISEPLEGAVKTPEGARGPVGERARRLAGVRDLRPLFEVRTRRRTFALRPERSSEVDSTLGEVALDEVEISGDGVEPTRLSRIEVEAAPAGLLEDIEEFVDGLRDALGLRPTEHSKFESGLSAAGLSPMVAPDRGPEESVGHSNGKDRR